MWPEHNAVAPQIRIPQLALKGAASTPPPTLLVSCFFLFFLFSQVSPACCDPPPPVQNVLRSLTTRNQSLSSQYQLEERSAGHPCSLLISGNGRPWSRLWILQSSWGCSTPSSFATSPYLPLLSITPAGINLPSKAAYLFRTCSIPTFYWLGTPLSVPAGLNPSPASLYSS